MEYRAVIGIIFTLLFFCMAIIFCAVIIKLYIKKVKEHNLKEIQFQKTLNQTIIETQEQVFENISQDLHDDIGQQLTFINFQLEKIKLDHDVKNNELEELSNSLSTVSRSIRSISHSMNNQLLVQNDILIAIKNEIERINKYRKLKVDLQNELKHKISLSDTEKIFLYRIFQEVISNILKHANASKITINIKDNPEFQLKIEDNGKGFDLTNKNNNSIGLTNINKRAELINFIVSIESKINFGTTVIIKRNYESKDKN